MAIIKGELLAIKDKHATPRMTEIVPDEGEIAIEDLIANEGVIITITHGGLIKRTNVSSYRSPAPRRQGRHRHGHARGSTPKTERRRFHRASLHREHARLPDVLHEHRPRVCGARPRDPGHGPRVQGQVDREPARAEGADEKIAALIRVDLQDGPEQAKTRPGSNPANSSSPRARAR